MKHGTCNWSPCTKTSRQYYCAKHAEQARRNTLRALGLAAPGALMWRDGDMEWLVAEAVKR